MAGNEDGTASFPISTPTLRRSTPGLKDFQLELDINGAAYFRGEDKHTYFSGEDMEQSRPQLQWRGRTPLSRAGLNAAFFRLQW